MKQVKPIVFVAAILFAAILLIPSLLVLLFSPSPTKGKLTGADPELDWETLLKEASTMEVSVYRSEKDEVETIPLEEYIVGVVAGEMPANFEEEALKAQSLTARTYIIRQLMYTEPEGLLKGADVSDTVTHQVYKDKEQLKEKWGIDYQKNIEKIQAAVYETRGQIITYDGEPITASFFSTSNGYTENSEAYWTTPVPYLKSVESPWDLDSKEFIAKQSFTVDEFQSKLGITLQGSDLGKILSRTPGNRVEKIQIGGKEFTGRQVREALGLRSTDFTWERKGNEIIVTTKGYGHGVGMSQYGANGMAKEGKTYEEIIKHYYQGVNISAADTYIEQYLANK